MAIDPNVQAMAVKMAQGRGGAPQPRQAEQPAPQQGSPVADQIRMLLTKALELLGPGGE